MLTTVTLVSQYQDMSTAQRNFLKVAAIVVIGIATYTAYCAIYFS